MIGILRIPTEVVYTLGNAFEGIVYALYTAVILTVGTVLWYLLWWCIEYVALNQERATTFVLKEKGVTGKTWIPRPVRSCGNVKHLIIQTLFFGGLVIIVWLASAAAGFNPWTSAAASLGLSVIATYAFATPLGLIGSGYFLHLTNAVAVGEFYEFYGMGPEWEGRVTAVYSMWVEMSRYNAEKNTGELIYIPISTFLTTPRKRVWIKEIANEEQFGILRREDAAKKKKEVAKNNKPPLSDVVIHSTAPAARKLAGRYSESIV